MLTFWVHRMSHPYEIYTRWGVFGGSMVWILLRMFLRSPSEVLRELFSPIMTETAREAFPIAWDNLASASIREMTSVHW